MFGTFDIQNFIVRYVVPLVGCVVAATATVYIMSEVNPLAAALFCAAIVFAVVTIVIPRSGLTILLLLCAFSDLLKRLLILVSELSYDQISLVLAAAPLVVTGLIVAVITRWAFRTVRMTRRDAMMGIFLIFAMSWSFAIEFLASRSLLDGIKASINSGLYVAMMPIATTFISTKEDVLRLLRIATLIFIPVAAYGIYQSIFGFADFEIQYLRSGLTITAVEDKPRPFSTLNSGGAFGDMTAIMAILSLIPYVATQKRELPLKPLLLPLAFLIGYATVCALGEFKFSLTLAAVGTVVAMIPFVVILGEGLEVRQRLVPLLLFVLFSTACICSLVRHSYFVLLAELVGIFCFRSLLRTWIFYGVGIALSLALVVSASYLLGNLAAWDPAASATSEFSERALGIQTYAERLKGFVNLTSSTDMWSAFGLAKDQKGTSTTYHHDPISGILVDYGVFVLAAVLGGFIWMVKFSHQRVLSLHAGTPRLLGVLLLSIMISIIASHILFYGVLTTFPINAFFWLFAGCLFSLISDGERSEKSEDDAASALLQPTARWAAPLQMVPEDRQSEWPRPRL